MDEVGKTSPDDVSKKMSLDDVVYGSKLVSFTRSGLKIHCLKSRQSLQRLNGSAFKARTREHV